MCKIAGIRQHSNADRLLVGSCFGSQVIVGLDTKEGDLGIYFPCDGQLSEAFAKANDLVRRKNEDGTAAGGMFDENRRVRAQKFRGEISDGFWMPLDSLKLEGASTKSLVELFAEKDGTELVAIGGVEICRKYVSNATHGARDKNNQRPAKVSYGSVMFKEHYDTGQWSRNLHQVHKGDLVVITEKLHGTSQRYGHVEVDDYLPKWKRFFIKLLLPKLYEDFTLTKWIYLNGTRRVVLKPVAEDAGDTSWHGNKLRELAIQPFKGNLRKSETVYFEVVGYEPEGRPIMNSVHVSKLKDKFFTALYGDGEMNFSYLCKPGESKVYVYRITTTNEDGLVYDYSWYDVKQRCEELGVAYVPELSIVHMSGDNTEFLEGLTDSLAKGPSTLDASHIREGVCVRLEGGLTPRVYKHKSFEFKVLEGIIKDSDVVDMEEAS